MKRKTKTPTPDNPYVLLQASFNYFDPDQRKLYDHAAKRTNCSEYLKRLIQRDIDGVTSAPKLVREDDELAHNSMTISMSCIKSLLV